MNIRTAKDVIEIARNRGFKVLVKPGPPPMPFLRGFDKDLATPSLMEALRVWRLEIIEELLRESAATESAEDAAIRAEQDAWQKPNAN